MKDLNDPTNRDTVPAMLTPEEFVLNKEATQMFGPIIEQMNNAGLQQRHAENQLVLGGMAYNTGGLVTFLKEKEGYRDKAYQDDAGVWTIGYGRTTNADGSKIKPTQKTNKKAEDKWLDGRATKEWDAVNKFAEQHGYDFNEGQLNALASFRFNGGPGMLNQLTANGTRDADTIAQKLPLYNKVTVDGKKIPIEGLTNRRNAELELWSGGSRKPAEPTAQEQVAPSQAGVEVPPMDAGFRGAITDAVSMAVQPNQPVAHQPLVQSTAPQQPQYIPSVTEKKVQTYNRGGFALSEEERKRRALLQRRNRNKPLAFRAAAEAKAPAQPQQPRRGPQDATPADSFQLPPQNPRQPKPLDVPTLQGQPPNIVDTPPVPGSDEAILQSSSQQQEQEEAQGPFDGYADYSQQDFLDEAETINNPGAQTQGYEIPGLRQPTAETLNAPIPEPDPTVDQSAPTPPQSPQQAAREELPTLDKKSDAQLVDTGNKVQSTVDKVIEEEGPVDLTKSQEIISAGQAEVAKDPAKIKPAADALSKVFGDLINPQELARMAVVFAGAMVTGASPGQALAISGQMYLQRIDAHANNFNQIATSGKYTPQSLKAYKATGDITVLSPVGTAPEQTGKFETLYTEDGKGVKVQEVKIGDNKVLMDEQGNIRSGFEFKGDPSEVRGTKEHRERVKTSTTQITKQLEEMRKTFDVFETKQGEGSKTDILPATSASKVAEWAIDNGVSPDELGGLVESAYHDALNDNRQDGARARNLVPYLQQLVIRQSVGGNAEVFKAKGGEGYVNAKKLQKINAAAASTLRRIGKQGGVNDLSNLFYTEALKDWNTLDEGTQKQWNRKALKDESGFYKFIENMLLKAGG